MLERDKRPPRVWLAFALALCAACALVSGPRFGDPDARWKYAFLIFCAALLGLFSLLLGSALVQRRSRPSGQPIHPILPSPSRVEPARELRDCDLIMKGGITSGIVYPKAICALAEQYRFRDIGGASAGAIAAGLTAAAEYGRRAGKVAGPGLPDLARLPAFLEKKGRLLELFRPDAETEPLFRLFVAWLGGSSTIGKLARALAAAIRWSPGWALASLLPGIVLGSWAWSAGARASGIAIAAAVTVVCLPAAMAIGAVASLLWISPLNWFGLCSGLAPAAPGAIPSLTDWLADAIDRLARGLSPDDSTPMDRIAPLTFGDLWGRGGPQGKDAINLMVLTNSLTHGRPYRIPFETRELFFRPDELERLFPKRVADWMDERTKDQDRGDGFRPLPPPKDFPVVVAVRMSLSFPVLLSAVPLYAVDYTSTEQKLERCWFSDGGIGSNFPIHFFDDLLPGRPTFGIDLTPPQRHWVYLPQRTADGRSEVWNRFSTLPGFLGALLNSIHSWMDNRQARVAGFRDRIVRISLAQGEGGLNVDMPATKIRELAARGEVAGRLLVEAFAAPGSTGWDAQRWTRYRTLMRLLEEQLPEAAHLLAGYGELEGAPLPFRMSESQRELSAWLRQKLIDLSEDWTAKARELDATMAAGAPKSRVSLRVTPTV